MQVDDIVGQYVAAAMVLAEYEHLEEDGVLGWIPPCMGVWGSGPTEERCATDMREFLEEWVWLGLKEDHPIPVIDNIDLRTPDVLDAIRVAGFWDRFGPNFGKLVGDTDEPTSVADRTLT